MTLFWDVGLHIASTFALCLIYWLTGEWNIEKFYAGFFLIGGAGLAVDFDHYRYIRAVYCQVKEEWLKDWEGSGRKFYQTWAFGAIFICSCFAVGLFCWFVLFLIPLYVGYIFTVKRRFLLFLRSEWKSCVDKAGQDGTHFCHTLAFAFTFLILTFSIGACPENRLLALLMTAAYFLHILIDALTDAELFPQNRLPASINRTFACPMVENGCKGQFRDAFVTILFVGIFAGYLIITSVYVPS